MLSRGVVSNLRASRTISLACKATLRDVGSDTSTFYGKKGEGSVRQLGENENVMLGEGDRVGFGPGESELYRYALGTFLCPVLSLLLYSYVLPPLMLK